MTGRPTARAGSEPSGGIPDADVHSPDGSVRIIASLGGQIAVHVQGLHRHNDESLARQVRAAARLTLARLQRSSAAPGPPAVQREAGR
ncbi:hypothetical protein CIK06_26390 [Plantactinospora sp. KBS50]|nr:hypothetical protein CIK06_26390 [Plantactinospora sp. KBS50]